MEFGAVNVAALLIFAEDRKHIEKARVAVGCVGARPKRAIKAEETLAGECGSCTVLVQGKPILSCLALAVDYQDQEVLTIEGVSKEGGDLSVVQQAFLEGGAVQCGFCTPGMMLSTEALKLDYVGGAFGGKVNLFSHEFCAARLSMITGRPAKIEATREEIFTAYRHGQPLIVEVKTGVKKDGTLCAQQFRIINNCGAFRGSGVVIIFLAWGSVWSLTGSRTSSMRAMPFTRTTPFAVPSGDTAHHAG
ncbi:MAG: molybdopterin-dependent oxidoreductase [Deltaproteobacteria bacterium]|nr:molybdopterin-dependent oxidoreductase [Deltaproteobacteria bacterium]